MHFNLLWLILDRITSFNYAITVNDIQFLLFLTFLLFLSLITEIYVRYITIFWKRLKKKNRNVRTFYLYFILIIILHRVAFVCTKCLTLICPLILLFYFSENSSFIYRLLNLFNIELHYMPILLFCIFIATNITF